jgi:hypothetical protein
MKPLLVLNTLLLSAILCGIISVYWDGSGEATAPSADGGDAGGVDLAACAAATIEKGDTGAARLVLSAAIAADPSDGKGWLQVVEATEKLLEATAASEQQAAALRGELAAGLAKSLARAKSRDEVSRLLAVHDRIASISAKTPSNASKQDAMPTHESPSDAHAPGPSHARPEPPTKPSGDDLAVMLREGLQDQNEDDQRRDALIQVALDGQAVRPDAIPMIWATLAGHVRALPEPSARVATLAVYLESLDAAIGLCEHQEQFERLWQIRKDVAKAQEECVGLWRNWLLKELDELHSKVQENGAAATLGEKPEDFSNLRSQIEAFESVQDTDNGVFLESVAEIGSAFKQKLQERISNLQSVALAQAKKDSQGEKIEPLKDETGKYSGPLEQLLQQLQALGAEMGSEAVSFWLSRIPAPTGTRETDEGLSEKMQMCAQTISDLQRRRYNLWALREIYTGGQSTNWEDYLGRIDLGILHPSVHSCYSIDHDDKLRSVRDPQIRQKAVITLLCKDKIPLQAF